MVRPSVRTPTAPRFPPFPVPKSHKGEAPGTNSPTQPAGPSSATAPAPPSQNQGIKRTAADDTSYSSDDSAERPAQRQRPAPAPRPTGADADAAEDEKLFESDASLHYAFAELTNCDFSSVTTSDGEGNPVYKPGTAKYEKNVKNGAGAAAAAAAAAAADGGDDADEDGAHGSDADGEHDSDDPGDEGWKPPPEAWGSQNIFEDNGGKPPWELTSSEDEDGLPKLQMNDEDRRILARADEILDGPQQNEEAQEGVQESPEEETRENEESPEEETQEETQKTQGDESMEM